MIPPLRQAVLVSRRSVPAMAALLALAAATPRPTAAQPPAPTDARAVLARVSETYRGLGRYDVRGISHVDITGASFNNKLDVPMRFVGDRPNRFRNEVQNPNFPSRYVADGDSVYGWLPLLRQYVVWPAGDAAVMADLDPGLGQSLFPLREYEHIGRRVRAARVLGPDTVRLDDRVADVLRLEVEYEPDTSRKDVSVWPRVYWVDTASGLVLRDSTRADVLHQQLGQLTTVQVTRLASAQLGGALDDSLFAFAVPGGAARAEAPQPPPALRMRGKPAPDFSLPRYRAAGAKAGAGAPVKLSALKGKVVLLDFWATWCGPCRRWMPIVEKVQKDLGPRGLQVYAVNLREPDDKIGAYLRQTGVSVPVLVDRDGRVGESYNAASIPLTVIVGRDGSVAQVLVGVHTEAQLRDALRVAGLD